MLYFHRVNYLKFHRKSYMMIKNIGSGDSHLYIQMMALSLANMWTEEG